MGLGFVKNIAKSYLNSRISSFLGEDGVEDMIITLSANGDEIILPVNPSSYKCRVGNNNEVVNINMAGDYLMRGKTGLKSLTLTSFFPAQEYNFVTTDADSGVSWGQVESIEIWRIENEVIDLTISGTLIEFTCLIDDFEYGEEDGSGDVYYSITLREYREIGADPKQIEEVTELNERKKPSYLQKVGANALRNVLKGEPPLRAVTNAVGQAGLTKKQQGYLEIGKIILRGGISPGDVIDFDNTGAVIINGKKIGKYDKESFNPRSWEIDKNRTTNIPVLH